ncbi:MAG: hypothetical protein OEV38_14665, partial [Nitrospira sp.]|nr:hypothetical protein [Nitrospira sp.]
LAGLCNSLSRMSGNHQVRFLGEGAAARPHPYPTHDYGSFGRGDQRRAIEGMLEHRTSPDERAVLFRTMAAQPSKDERLHPFAITSGQNDRPHILACHALSSHEIHPFPGASCRHPHNPSQILSVRAMRPRPMITVSNDVGETEAATPLKRIRQDVSRGGWTGSCHQAIPHNSRSARTDPAPPPLFPGATSR